MELNINDFNGPLDLLLHMVKKHQMNIYNIDIKIIIDEYIAFIDSLERTDLDSKSEYLIMAAELIHLKSKLLLGYDEDENDDNYEIQSEEDLKNRILEFEKYQTVSDKFRNLENNRQDFFTKVPENIRNLVEDDEKQIVNEGMNIKYLVEAYLEMNQRLEYQKPRVTTVTKKEISVKDRINYIRNILQKEAKVEFSSLIQEYSKEELVVTFLSILEMSKNHEIILSQDKIFCKIYIERHA